MRHFLTLVLAVTAQIMIAPPSLSHGRNPDLAFQFKTEYTSSSGELSSAASAQGGMGPMPDVQMSLTATLYGVDEPPPSTTILLSITPEGYAFLDRTSATTDSNGQCRVNVQGSGGTHTDMTRVTVKARISGTAIERTCAIDLRTYNTTYAESTVWHSALAVPFYYSIHWSMDKMLSAASQSRTDFTAPSEIWFVNGSPPLLEFHEEYNPNGVEMARTDISAVPYKIVYNMYNLDGLYIAPLQINPYARLGWRHHIRTKADHEMGHALLFNDNPTFDKSLMFGSPENYFVSKTVVPRADSEWIPLHANY